MQEQKPGGINGIISLNSLTGELGLHDSGKIAMNKHTFATASEDEDDTVPRQAAMVMQN